jgi:predicted small lipoprotein YifL
MSGFQPTRVGASPRRLALAAAGVVLLAACGQKGPLFLPAGEAAAGRATLGDLITPSTSSTPAAPSTAVTVPATPASAPTGTGRASPITVP